jgi:hypothetical protein
MRIQKQLVFYQSILDVLSETGCPFCRFLKDHQTAHIQSHMSRNISNLCSFHALVLAAVQSAMATAQVFIDLFDRAAPTFDERPVCDVCREIAAEVNSRIREFASCIHRTGVMDWLSKNAVFCVPHGIKLRRQVQPVVAARIDAILESYREQLEQELEMLRNDPQAARPGWGSLRRAA